MERAIEKSEEVVKVGSIIQFYDCPSSKVNSKAKNRWMRGRIVGIGESEGNTAFLVVRENGLPYLVMPKDIKRDNVSAPFKTPKKFKQHFAPIDSKAL